MSPYVLITICWGLRGGYYVTLRDENDVRVWDQWCRTRMGARYTKKRMLRLWKLWYPANERVDPKL